MRHWQVKRLPEDVVCFVRGSGLERAIRHVQVHSPTGFETGYAGSGPADLALSILADYFGETPHRAKTGKAWQYHQWFKVAFITPNPIQETESYMISEAEITQFIKNLIHQEKG